MPASPHNSPLTVSILLTPPSPAPPPWHTHIHTQDELEEALTPRRQDLPAIAAAASAAAAKAATKMGALTSDPKVVAAAAEAAAEEVAHNELEWCARCVWGAVLRSGRMGLRGSVSSAAATVRVLAFCRPAHQPQPTTQQDNQRTPNANSPVSSLQDALVCCSAPGLSNPLWCNTQCVLPRCSWLAAD